MNVEFIDIVLFILLFQLLILPPYLLLHKTGRRKANMFLAVFLLAKALCISNFLSFRLYDTAFANFPHSFYFGSSFTLLWGPTLFLYTKSLFNKNFALKKTDLIHFLPFACHFIYLTFTYHINSADIKRELLLSGTVFSSNMLSFLTLFLQVTIFLYIASAFRLVSKYSSALKNTYSKIDNIDLSWIYFVLFGFLAKWMFDNWYLTEVKLLGMTGMLPLYLSRIVLFLFINIMIYKGLKYPVIFTGITLNEKVKKVSLSKTVADQYLEKLSEFMEQGKPYLEPEITLNDLAERVSIPPRSLSEILNTALGKNFYDYINYYRIKESEQLFAETSSHNKTVLEVLYEVGFNSKSSFNTAFKKHTGMTPSQYKKVHNSKLMN